VQAACLLTVSDVLNEEEGTEETYLSLDDLDAAVERMIEVALTAAVQSGT
jgi:purine-nucleoside phosphorylase